jgi:transposase
LCRPASAERSNTAHKKRRSPQNHPGRNELPEHLERVDKIIACPPEICTCNERGGDTKAFGYDVSEVIDRLPVEFSVIRIMDEKHACASCIEQGVATAPTPERSAPKSIFSDEAIISFWGS